MEDIKMERESSSIFKVFEEQTPQEIESKVEQFSEENGMMVADFEIFSGSDTIVIAVKFTIPPEERMNGFMQGMMGGGDEGGDIGPF